MNRIISRQAGSRLAGKNIVIIGGGTGTSTLLQGLKKYPLNLSVIVSTADDGGSTGILRKQLGVVPPGDIRQCLIALARDKNLAEVLAHRFNRGLYKGHTVGNLVLASLEKEFGSPEKAIELVSILLNAQGQVLPVTLKATLLSAKLENGKIIVGEHNIDQPISSQQSAVRIKQLQLKPTGPANPKALAAIKYANMIVFGPGDLYTSTLPNLLVEGVRESVNKSKAKKVFITNIMNKHGQTDSFKASDFVNVLQKYLGGKINYVLANNKKPNADILKKYEKEKSQFVEPDIKELIKLKVESFIQDFISEQIVKPKAGDKLKRSFIRHDNKKLAKLIFELV